MKEALCSLCHRSFAKTWTSSRVFVGEPACHMPDPKIEEVSTHSKLGPEVYSSSGLGASEPTSKKLRNPDFEAKEW